jgi:NADH-quinone oxidoreductase subunit F
MVYEQREVERYVVCNASESEPGTYKDRFLIQRIPHRLLEGIAIASYVIGARVAYLYIKEKYVEEVSVAETAIEETCRAGYLGQNILGSGFDLEIRLFRGPDSYVTGEETAMLAVIQGLAGKPREKPPFYPTTFGLFKKPTLVNNAETLANIPIILNRGDAWFSKIGVPHCTGTMLFSVSGAVNRPGVYELPMGTPLRELIYECGQGIREGKRLKAVFPGGPSTTLLTEDHLDLSMDFDSFKKAGTALGSAGMLVFDENTCMVATVLEFSRFFAKESCGQCPPCSLGTVHMSELLERIESGDGERADLDALIQLCGIVKGKGICTVVTGASLAVQSTLKYFFDEYESHLAGKACDASVESCLGKSL